MWSHTKLQVPFGNHTHEIKCQVFENYDSTGSNLQKLKFDAPIQNKGLVGKTFCSAGTYTTPLSDTESHSHVNEEKVGVLLLNLGGPETLHDVQPFLFNLFADPVSLLLQINNLIIKNRSGHFDAL